MPNLNEIIVQIAHNTYNALKPTDVIFGTVISKTPLRISIEQKLILSKNQLLLSSLVSDFDVNMSVNHTTENASEHSHEYKGTKVFNVKLGLQTGEQVVLIRQNGGQKYLVLDRVR